MASRPPGWGRATLFASLLGHVDSALCWCIALLLRETIILISPSLGSVTTGSLLALLILQLSASHLLSVPHLLCNVCLIIPFNAIAVPGFFLLTPIRWLYNHLVTYLMAPKMDPSIAPLRFDQACREKWVMCVLPVS